MKRGKNKDTEKGKDKNTEKYKDKERDKVIDQIILPAPTNRNQGWTILTHSDEYSSPIIYNPKIKEGWWRGFKKRKKKYFSFMKL